MVHPPDTHHIQPIENGGNCLFRCLLCMITGSQDQYVEICAMIVTYLPNIAYFLLI